MQSLGLDQFNALLQHAPIKLRLKRGLRFVASVANVEDWDEYELLPITDRSNTKGVLLIEPDAQLFVAAYELSRSLTNRQTGRAQPVICDFCKTWQAGSNAARISFKKDPQSLNSVSFLCCADLRCSSHVRGKTHAATISKAHLREDLTTQQRIKRLKNSLRNLVNTMKLIT